jgi:hypothetical protein
MSDKQKDAALRNIKQVLMAWPGSARKRHLHPTQSRRSVVLYLERNRARDKAFLRGGIVQAARNVLIRAGRELDVRAQSDAFELPSAVRLLDLHAGGVVAVCYDHDTGVDAKMQSSNRMVRPCSPRPGVNCHGASAE